MAKQEIGGMHVAPRIFKDCKSSIESPFFGRDLVVRERERERGRLQRESGRNQDEEEEMVGKIGNFGFKII